MTESRIRYADILNGILKGTKGLKLPEKADDCRWNYQYYVIHAGKQADHLYHQMFARGIHVMKEDVWDCPRYPFAREYYRPCPVASEYTPGLIRIQNNSMMSEKRIRKIAGIIRQIIEEKDIRG
jgi:dTDP-4-amino-4,6-dideoxygalactose transaminase